MAKNTINADTKELKKEYQADLISWLDYYIKQYFIKNDIEVAKIQILDNKNKIIEETTKKLYNLKNAYSKSKYQDKPFYYSYNKIKLDVINQFLKAYKNNIKLYDERKKAQKEAIKSLLYNKISQDIEEAKKYRQTSDIITILKTSNYKNALIDDLLETKSNYNIDINILNDVYITVLNKVIREYKNDIEQQEEAKKSDKIPLGWKVYGTLKILDKLFKL